MTTFFKICFKIFKKYVWSIFCRPYCLLDRRAWFYLQPFRYPFEVLANDNLGMTNTVLLYCMHDHEAPAINWWAKRVCKEWKIEASKALCIVEWWAKACKLCLFGILSECKTGLKISGCVVHFKSLFSSTSPSVFAEYNIGKIPQNREFFLNLFKIFSRRQTDKWPKELVMQLIPQSLLVSTCQYHRIILDREQFH